MRVEQSVPANVQVEQSVFAAPQVGQPCLAVLLVVSTQLERCLQTHSLTKLS